MNNIVNAIISAACVIALTLGISVTVHVFASLPAYYDYYISVVSVIAGIMVIKATSVSNIRFFKRRVPHIVTFFALVIFGVPTFTDKTEIVVWMLPAISVVLLVVTYWGAYLMMDDDAERQREAGQGGRNI